MHDKGSTNRRARRSDRRRLPLILIAGLALAGPAWADMTPTLGLDTAAPLIAVEPAVIDTLSDDTIAGADGGFSPDVVEEGFERIGEGEASYYGHELAGNRTASGERFDPSGLTAAHRTLPLGSKLRVTNLGNGQSVVVRINDRGPFVKKRLIDVSLAAARKINMIRAGKAMVKLELLR